MSDKTQLQNHNDIIQEAINKVKNISVGEDVEKEVDEQEILLARLAAVIDKLANPPTITGENGEVEFANIDYTYTEDGGLVISGLEITDDGNGNVTLQY